MSRPSRPWFRFYTEAVYDRKLRRLPPETRWLFVVVLALARQSPVPGLLFLTEQEFVGWDDLVDAAAMPLKKVQAGMDELCVVGVVAFDGRCWSVPRWNDRQFESDDVTKRTTKHRSKERSQTVPGNAPDTEADTETEKPPLAPPAKFKRPSRKATDAVTEVRPGPFVPDDYSDAAPPPDNLRARLNKAAGQ